MKLERTQTIEEGADVAGEVGVSCPTVSVALKALAMETLREK